MGVGVLDEIKAISAQLGLGFGLSLAIKHENVEKIPEVCRGGVVGNHYSYLGILKTEEGL